MTDIEVFDVVLRNGGDSFETETQLILGDALRWKNHIDDFCRITRDHDLDEKIGRFEGPVLRIADTGNQVSATLGCDPDSAIRCNRQAFAVKIDRAVSIDDGINVEVGRRRHGQTVHEVFQCGSQQSTLILNYGLRLNYRWLLGNIHGVNSGFDKEAIVNRIRFRSVRGISCESGQCSPWDGGAGCRVIGHDGRISHRLAIVLVNGDHRSKLIAAIIFLTRRDKQLSFRNRKQTFRAHT